MKHELAQAVGASRAITADDDSAAARPRLAAEAALPGTDPLIPAYARAFEHAPVGIVVRNPEGCAVWVNDAACRMLGYERAEFLATPIPQFVHAEDLAVLSEQAQRVLQGELAGCRVAVRYHHKQGGTVHAQVYLSVVRTNDGRPEAIVSQLQDVTAQKLAEAKLLQRVEFERIVTALATDFINLPSESIDRGVRAALEEVAAFSGAERAGVFLVRRGEERVDLTHEWKRAGLSEHVPLLRNIPLERFGWLLAALQRGDPVRVDDLGRVATRDDEARNWLISEGIVSLVAVPIIHDDALAGFVGFAGAKPVAPDAESVALLRIVAEMLDNVLDRKATEGALRESDERFRQMADNVHQLFWIAELDPPRIVYASPAFESIWGVSRNSLEGDPQKFHSLVYPEDIEAVMAFYMDALTGPRELEYRILLANGSIRWLRARAFPVCNQAGEVYRVAGVADDVTEAKRAAEEIAHRTELERLIRDLATEFINLPEARIDAGIEAALRKLGEFAGVDVSYILLLGEDGNSFDRYYAWISPGCGVERSDMEGLSLDRFPWYRERLATRDFVYLPSIAELGGDAAAEKAACTGRGIRSVISVPMIGGPDGNAVLGCLGFNSIRAPKHWSEEVITLLKIAAGMFVSALERQRSQQALEELSRRNELILQAAGEGIYGVDLDGRITFVNPAAERMLGWAAAEVVGEKPHGLFHHSHAASAARSGDACVVCESLRDGAVHHAEEEPFWHKNGTSFPVEYVTTPIRDGDRVVGAVVVFRDVTERKRSAETLRRHEAELAHALRLGTLGELAAGLAHELNQPLSAISSYASGCERRLRGGNVDVSELLKAVEEVSRQALRAGDVIRTLRAHVRKREPRREWCDVNQLIEASLRLVRGDLADHDISLRCELSDELPPVQVDSIQIEQVLLNLIRNGVDAIASLSNGTRELCVTSRRASANEVEVAVADTGKGIAAEDCDAVFDAFFTTKSHGLGLGLSISRSIVGGHGGRLWAAPNAGGGARFAFTLPLSQPEGRDGRRADSIHR